MHLSSNEPRRIRPRIKIKGELFENIKYAAPASAESRTKLLGDRLAAFFAEHGLTPESYQRWKADHGIDAILGAGCGCDKRKELLNKADAAVRGGAAKLRAFMGW